MGMDAVTHVRLDSRIFAGLSSSGVFQLVTTEGGLLELIS